MTQDMSNKIMTREITQRYRFSLRECGDAIRCVILLLLMVVGVNTAWGQDTDYSGTYYIASNYRNPTSGIHIYDDTTLANNYYLCPTDGWYYYKATDDFWPSNTAEENKTMPFLTTFKCRTAAYDSYGGINNAKWIVSKNGNYYTFQQTATGKYMVFNGQINTTTNADRMRVHLETVPGDLPDNALFSITTHTDGVSIIISPLSIPTDHLTVNGGNSDYLYAKANSGQANKTGGPSNANTNGIIGIYRNNQTDDAKYFYLEDYITRPTITYNDASDEITITAVQLGVNLIYTTDGSTPSTSNPNATTITGTEGNTTTVTFNPSDGETTIKAVAVVGGELSNIATYTTPVFIGNNHKYLIQSVENTNFYMIQGDYTDPEIRINTSSLARPSMVWYFLNAGVTDGVQYYYMVNNKEGQYACFYKDVSNKDVVCLKEASDFDSSDQFKFSIHPHASGGYFIKPLNYSANNGLNKGNGNNEASNVWVAGASNATARWNFIGRSAVTLPLVDTSFDVSTDNKTYYYKIGNAGTTDPVYYIIPPTGTTGDAQYAKTNSGEDDNMAWYFKQADSDDWLNYYYIVNGQTGKYLYYNGQIPTDEGFSTSNNPERVFTTEFISESGKVEDRYQFVFAKTTTDGHYYIVPKFLKDCSNTSYYMLWRDGTKTLRVNLQRKDASRKWTFTSTIYNCAQPEITWSAGDGGYVVTSTESDAKIYYSTMLGEGELTPSNGTLYTGAISVADLGVESATIRVIAARNSDGSDASSEASVTVNRVAIPIISLTEDGKVEITCATDGAIIYYEIGVSPSAPTTTSTSYTGPIEGAAGKVIKAIAVKDGWISSEVATSETIVFTCATPVIRKTSATTFSIECSFPTTGVTIRYTIGDGTQDAPTASTGIEYTSPISFSTSDLPFTVKAIAIATDYNNSEVAIKELTESLNEDVDGYYEIASADDFDKFIDMVNSEGAGYKFKITTDITLSGNDAISVPFTGELKGVAKIDGTFPVISGLNHSLFNTVNDGTVKNVILDNVKISGGTNVGAICNEATGDSRIYNCGVLATNSTVTKDEDGYTDITFTSRSSTISGSGYVGGIVGLLDGSSRVINCFSYANVSGGSHVGGIVGYNNVETTSSNLKTMVMNCMFYGDITSGTSKAPIYNGKSIVNKDASGVSNFNYFLLEAPYMDDRNTTKTYNCALAAEKRYLQRFEYFRHLLNSHRELAGWWATGTYSSSEMAKWVLEPSQIGTSTCYPILKTPGYYPSVVNLDAENATIQTERNKGGKLGTLSVTIQMGSGGAQFAPPTGASITTSSLTLNTTDKDPDHFNFNYNKVQLPYYNDVGTKNYTSNLVVTGWKIVSITGGTTGSYTAGEDASTDANGNITATPYNFADRKCTNKDLYSVSGRVFNQGAYWDVPDGVTAITIQPYWAKAAYFADAYADVVYDESMGTSYNVPNVGGGQIYTNGNNYNIAGEQQKVYTSIDNAKDAIGEHSGHTVYDYAVVLVGNAHNIGVSSDKTTHFYTIMSADFDHDNEPDYTYILRFNNRNKVHPVRLDFVNIPGLGMAQKSTGGTGTYNFGIAQPLSWFESTNTSLFRVTQFEYDNSSRIEAPYILQGGIIEQWVSGQDGGAANKTIYYHVGGNVWFNEFHRGTHQDKTLQSKHPPVSVTGGDYDQFYLTGLYKAVTAYNDDAECYINGGRFGIVAGTGLEGIGDAGNHTKGNIIWQIQNADINEFYGGGINAASPSQGNITTVITGGYIKQFCGGPKFGDMQSGRTVKTTATDCTFDTYFGAGYGGNSYSRQTPYNYNNKININWNKWVKGEQKAHADSKYHGYIQEYRNETDASYEGGIFEGVSTQIAYQFIPMSGNADNCARLWIEYVKFSLATTHSVTSNLTGCIITGNFYGGGSLGKVDGPVNSTLTNCTVNGNVFGAGFSASLPVVKVMNTGGFTEEPYYDQDLGIYLPATFPETVDYTWKHADTVNSTATAIKTTETEHFLYTEVDISTSNLGSVQGNVILTIQTDAGKTTTIGTAGNPNTGNVFGGGEQSYVTNSTDPVTIHDVTVNLKGSGTTNILGNVFGGGDQGTVEGNAKVNIMVPDPPATP